jgi:hypothetical protein
VGAALAWNTETLVLPWQKAATGQKELNNNFSPEISLKKIENIVLFSTLKNILNVSTLKNSQRVSIER